MPRYSRLAWIQATQPTKNRTGGPLRLAAAIAAALCTFHAPAALSQLTKSEKIGPLLYESNCLSCHLAKADWREKHLVTDWPSMKSEIGRWQQTLGLRWNEQQIDQVAIYLNRRYYKLAPP